MTAILAPAPEPVRGSAPLELESPGPARVWPGPARALLAQEREVRQALALRRAQALEPAFPLAPARAFRRAPGRELLGLPAELPQARERAPGAGRWETGGLGRSQQSGRELGKRFEFTGVKVGRELIDERGHFLH